MLRKDSAVLASFVQVNWNVSGVPLIFMLNTFVELRVQPEMECPSDMLPEPSALRVTEAPPPTGFQVPTKGLVVVAVVGVLLPPLLLPPLLQPIIPIIRIKKIHKNIVLAFFIDSILSWQIIKFFLSTVAAF